MRHVPSVVRLAVHGRRASTAILLRERPSYLGDSRGDRGGGADHGGDLPAEADRPGAARRVVGAAPPGRCRAHWDALASTEERGDKRDKPDPDPRAGEALSESMTPTIARLGVEHEVVARKVVVADHLGRRVCGQMPAAARGVEVAAGLVEGGQATAGEPSASTAPRGAAPCRPLASPRSCFRPGLRASSARRRACGDHDEGTSAEVPDGLRLAGHPLGAWGENMRRVVRVGRSYRERGVVIELVARRVVAAADDL
jgi:hypothetical protein